MEFASKENTSAHCKYSSKSSPKDLCPFTRVSVPREKKGNIKIFQPLNTASELTLISRNQKYQWELCGAHTGQVIDGVPNQVQITVGPAGLRTYLAVIPQFLNVQLE